MTVVPEDKKYSLSIWLRQPARKIRMANCDDRALDSVASALRNGDKAEIHGPTKAGAFVVIPASNIAYMEAIEL